MSSTGQRRPDMLILVVLTLAAAVLVSLIEIGLGCCLSLKAYGVYAAVCSAVFIPLVFWRFRAAKVALYIVFMAWLAVLWAVPWTSRKPFLRDLFSIKPGMTVAQADTIMSPYIREGSVRPVKWAYLRPIEERAGRRLVLTDIRGRRTDDTPLSQICYRHSNSAAFNADLGEVYFLRGRVVYVEFLPD